MGDGELARAAARHARVHLPAVQPDPDADRARRTSRPRSRPPGCPRRRAPPAGGRAARARRARPRAATICPSQLSGGEQQRVAIARALANEPARAAGRRADRQPRLRDGRGRSGPAARGCRRSEGLTVVLITHDPSIADARRARRADARRRADPRGGRTPDEDPRRRRRARGARLARARAAARRLRRRARRRTAARRSTGSPTAPVDAVVLDVRCRGSTGSRSAAGCARPATARRC